MKFSPTCIATAVLLALAPLAVVASPKRSLVRGVYDGTAGMALSWERELRASSQLELAPAVQASDRSRELRDPAAGIVFDDAHEPLTLKWFESRVSGRSIRSSDRHLLARMPTESLQRERKRALALLDDEALEPAIQLLERLREQLPRDSQVVGGLGLAWLRQGRHGEAEPLFAQALLLDPDNANKWKSLLRTARYWKLLKQAAGERDRKEYSTAFSNVRAAMELEPQNVEGIALYASVLYASGDAAQAEIAYRHGLEIEVENGSAIRGLTKLLVDQQRLAEALALLDSLGRSSRDIGGKFTYLRVGILRDQADGLVQRGSVDEARSLLENAVSMEPENAWARFDLAILLMKVSPERSRNLIDEGRKLSSRDSDMQYASALYFAKLDEPDLALACLSQIAAVDITPSIARLTRRMTIQSVLLQVALLDKRGQVVDAAALLDRAKWTAGDDPDFLYSLANAWMGRGEPIPALDLLRSALARGSSPRTALKLRFASLLHRAQRDAELAPVLSSLLKQTDLTESDRSEVVALERLMNMRIAYAHLKSGNVGAAQELAQQMEREAPEDSRILILQGNIARREERYDDAMAYYRRANVLEVQSVRSSGGGLTEAQEEIDTLERRRQARVSLAYDRRSKPGTPGISDMTVVEVPLEVRLPVGYHGHTQLNIEQVDIRAGAFDLTDAYALMRYGKLQALSPTGLASSTLQEAKGTTLVIGYEADNWRFDLGTTPVGFPVQNLVGGVRWYRSTPRLSVSVEVSRRAVTSSLLSFAGAQDPVSGEVWGGVRSTGASLRLARDFDSFDAALTMGYRLLDGKNVLGNTHLEMRPQVSWTLMQDKDMRLSTGLSYTYWKFAEDLSYYTFGHGGYYSPQTYQSIALPLRWSGANGRLAYSVDGSISASWTQSKDMPYYPTDAALQALAGNPMHVGGDSNGTGFSLSAAFEYQLAPLLALGGRWEVGRAAYYAPNAAMVYLRYSFDRPREEAASAPEIPRASPRF